MTTAPPSLASALAAGPVVLDGGLATLLEAHGADLSSDLWSARMLRDDPDAIVAAHAEYFTAGAQVAITASYQASFEGLAGLGLDRDAAAALMRSSVELARRAARTAPGSGPRWVAASVGPYGAVLADGSEYTGAYGRTVDELRRWHRPRLAELIAAEPDVLALETIPGAVEAQALLAEIAGTGQPAWLALTCSGTRTRAGEDAAEVFAAAAEVPEIIAVGVNCTDSDDVDDLVALAAQASGRPVVAYPNSGERWDAVGRRWAGEPTFGTDQVAGWVTAGARLVGGCCRVGPEAIRAIAARVH